MRARATYHLPLGARRHSAERRRPPSRRRCVRSSAAEATEGHRRIRGGLADSRARQGALSPLASGSRRRMPCGFPLSDGFVRAWCAEHYALLRAGVHAMKSALRERSDAGATRESSASSQARLHTKSYQRADIALNTLSDASAVSQSAEQVTTLPAGLAHSTANGTVQSVSLCAMAGGQGGGPQHAHGETGASLPTPPVGSHAKRVASRHAARRQSEPAQAECAHGLTAGVSFHAPTFSSLHEARCSIACSAFVSALSLDEPGAIRWRDPAMLILVDREALRNAPRRRVYG